MANNLKREDIKKIFKKYSLDTLDSIGLLLCLVDSNDDMIHAFDSVYQDKYEKNAGDFEGREDYDEICLLLNFNIAEVLRNLDKLNKDEMSFMVGIIQEAHAMMKQQEEKYSSIMPDLELVLAKYQKMVDTGEILPCLETADDDFTNRELENFFRKYSYAELGYMKTIFSYVYGFELDRIHKAYTKVVDEKEKELKDNFEVPVYSYSSNISDISRVNPELNIKELEMFKTFVESADMCLSNTDNIEVENERVETYKLYDSLEKEYANRKRAKVQKLAPKQNNNPKHRLNP